MITKIKTFIYSLIIQIILRFKNFKSTETIIIFSEARGGSTWLMEIINKLLKTSINWEPLHINHGVVPKKYKFGWNPFIPNTDINTNYISLFENIHSFNISSNWTRKYLKINTLLKSKYVLTKYVRANLLLPYFMTKFKFKFPPVFLLRHPIDTCISQIKAFDSTNDEDFKVPDCINNERFSESHDFIKQLESRLEIKIAIWCLNNCATIKQLKKFNVLTLFYSDLILNPQKELKNIFNVYNINIEKKQWNQIDFNKASSTNFKGDLIKDPTDQLNKNFEKIDDTMKQKIQKIFDYFDFRLYNAYTPLPNKNEL